MKCALLRLAFLFIFTRDSLAILVAAGAGRGSGGGKIFMIAVGHTVADRDPRAIRAHPGRRSEAVATEATTSRPKPLQVEDSEASGTENSERNDSDQQ